MTLPTPATPDKAPARRRPPSVIVPGRVRPSAIGVVIIAVVLTGVQVVNSLTGYALNGAGIRPRSLGGLWGILDAPLLHQGWSHLWTNLVPVVILSFLILIAGLRQFIAVTVLIWIVSGFGVWLTAPAATVTVGASLLVFGWLSFLVVRGFFTRRAAQIIVGLVLLAAWGGLFYGVLPGRADISWQGHLFGAVGGILAAFLVSRADATRRATAQGQAA